MSNTFFKRPILNTLPTFLSYLYQMVFLSDLFFLLFTGVIQSRKLWLSTTAYHQCTNYLNRSSRNSISFTTITFVFVFCIQIHTHISLKWKTLVYWNSYTLNCLSTETNLYIFYFCFINYYLVFCIHFLKVINCIYFNKKISYHYFVSKKEYTKKHRSSQYVFSFFFNVLHTNLDHSGAVST